MNKRDTKAMNKATRWQNPVSIQEINQFYSKYNDFISAAKEYRQKVLRVDSPPVQEPPKR